MEAVEDDADIRLVGTPDDLPGVAIVGDMPAPGERLESHPKTTRSGALAEFAEVGRRAVDAAERDRRDVAADQQQISAQFLHQVELALGASEIPRTLRLGHALEIPERLVGADRKPEIGAERGDVPGPPVEAKQVIFEDFDRVKFGVCDGSQFFFQRSTERDGGDRACHHWIVLKS